VRIWKTTNFKMARSDPHLTIRLIVSQQPTDPSEKDWHDSIIHLTLIAAYKTERSDRATSIGSLKKLSGLLSDVGNACPFSYPGI
jgi:hypothetical protein